ncbi:uncharacterized protein EKO05_0006975 [Ascochyta rabiei]|uniref:Uncharacterized protein n=1 Tax=Didymella rabiei TaxID=5454 RepID=A0A162YZI1_DIDRA|nr:uncharacterized protein EKO05_0006975 [Ascochyta rabiei]KZM20317.1 hypothetical protein ST47_g8461 [Ascochyta rabiei]UPX16584.1 hypothetical protein EKO05_0006975 [Ascochyta rabiei]
MGALLSLPITLLNLLLPFTKPGTPVAQDLIHTAVLCGTLYYAPQIAEWYNTRQLGNTTDGLGQDTNHDQEQETQQNEPHDVRDVPQEPRPQTGQPGLQAHVEDEIEPAAPQPGPAEQHQQPQPNGAFELPEDAGPANERPRPTPQNRAVGAKKAKSLARKDQRRAYHEFHRQEAELRRLQAAEGAEERDAALAAEKARRAAAEAEIVERERREREERKREVERELEEEQERRERVVRSVRDAVDSAGCVDLVDVAWTEGKDRVWVERLVRASGVLGQLAKDGAKVLITSQGWLVRVDKDIMERVYADAEKFGEARGGKVGFNEFGGMLERAVRARARV